MVSKSLCKFAFVTGVNLDDTSGTALSKALCIQFLAKCDDKRNDKSKKGEIIRTPKNRAVYVIGDGCGVPFCFFANHFLLYIASGICHVDTSKKKDL